MFYSDVDIQLLEYREVRIQEVPLIKRNFKH